LKDKEASEMTPFLYPILNLLGIDHSLPTDQKALLKLIHDKIFAMQAASA
jgi:hypothetical protein